MLIHTKDYACTPVPGAGEGGLKGVLWISSHGDELRIFGGEIFESRFFWVGKFGKYFFGWLFLRRDFMGIQNYLKIHGTALVSHIA